MHQYLCQCATLVMQARNRMLMLVTVYLHLPPHLHLPGQLTPPTPPAPHTCTCLHTPHLLLTPAPCTLLRTRTHPTTFTCTSLPAVCLRHRVPGGQKAV